MVVSFQQGTGLTMLFIFTLRPTGTLGSSRTGQGLVSTEGSITGTGRQNLRTCTGSLNRLGGRPRIGSLNRLGGIPLDLISSGWNSITGGLNKAGTGNPCRLSQFTGASTRFKKWLLAGDDFCWLHHRFQRDSKGLLPALQISQPICHPDFLNLKMKVCCWCWASSCWIWEKA